jgi:serine/threonine-protein kinase RsbT
VSDEVRIAIGHESDIVAARKGGRTLGEGLGFSSGELTVIATAISEVARNIVVYAGQGEILLSIVASGARRGLRVVARDDGPGIPDIEKAMQDGYSTRGGLGLGLPGARRLMDDFTVESATGQGTRVTMTKWARR